MGGVGQHLRKLENAGAFRNALFPPPHTHPFHLDLSRFCSASQTFGGGESYAYLGRCMGE